MHGCEQAHTFQNISIAEENTHTSPAERILCTAPYMHDRSALGAHTPCARNASPEDYIQKQGVLHPYIVGLCGNTPRMNSLQLASSARAAMHRPAARSGSTASSALPLTDSTWASTDCPWHICRYSRHGSVAPTWAQIQDQCELLQRDRLRPSTSACALA